ncbi:MAG: glutamine amidotransferase [Hyphomicrobiales bacterium]|nr:glutamine amidotransferase [Hyphomicrobiales bacterium]
MNSQKPKRVLIVLHQEHSSPGRIGRLLQEQGAVLDIRRPPCGDALPCSMDQHDGVVIFGGPMSANDSDAWIRREIDWIGVPLRAGKPFLGVCLGGQLLARHLGHRVYAQPDGSAEIGYYDIRPTEAGDCCFGGVMPRTVYQWHKEGFDLPRGAVALAEGDLFPTQAYRYGDNAVGLQFHPEVTYAIMQRWTVRAYERMQLPNAKPGHAHLEGWFHHDAPVAAWLERFLRNWLAAQPQARRERIARAPAQASAHA